MTVPLALALLFAAPPAEEPSSSDAPPVEQPVEPGEPGEQPEPPAPKIEGPGPEVPAPAPAPEPNPRRPPAPVVRPATPPLPAGAAEIEYEERNLADLPYAPTAARKSAVSRNNVVLVRPFRQPVYSIAAAGRFATLLGGGADVVQRFGYGFAAQLYIHALPVGRSRFGAEVHAGHTRFQERQEFEGVAGVAGDESITRIKLLTHTDFSAGPSLGVPIGPVFVHVGGSAGVALSTLRRPITADERDDDQITATNFMLRGGLSLGIPVLNNHGLTIGAGLHHIFSPRDVAIDLAQSDGPTTRPFSTWLEAMAAYQMWF